MPDRSPLVRAAARLHTERLLSHPNVVAVGAGSRTRKGATTEEPAVVVYVTQKLPREALLPTELVPRTVFTEDDEIRTDVVQVGVPRFVRGRYPNVSPATRRLSDCQLSAAGRELAVR